MSSSMAARRQKSRLNPNEKFYISVNLVIISVTIPMFTDEGSVHISCEFY